VALRKLTEIKEQMRLRKTIKRLEEKR